MIAVVENEENVCQCENGVKIEISEGASSENDNRENIENLDPELLRKITTIYENEKKIISWMPLMFFIVLSGVSIGYPLLKGSSSQPSKVEIKLCSPGYFGLNIAYYIFMILMNIVASDKIA